MVREQLEIGIWVVVNTGKFLVSREDYDLALAFTWTIHPTGCVYTRTYEDDKTKPIITFHSQILPAKVGYEIDHRNGDETDNRRTNLRYATPSQNKANRGRWANKKTSQYKGVYKQGNRWKAIINKDKKEYYLGFFKTETEAAVAYDEAAKKHFGEFARLNFE
jgi:hypothetical protein